MEGVDGLAAVDECALPSGFRATVFTFPVGVIDVAVRVVASVRTTDMVVVLGCCRHHPGDDFDHWETLPSPMVISSMCHSVHRVLLASYCVGQVIKTSSNGLF